MLLVADVVQARRFPQPSGDGMGVLERLKNLDVNNLTPIEAINLLNKIKKEI